MRSPYPVPMTPSLPPPAWPDPSFPFQNEAPSQGIGEALRKIWHRKWMVLGLTIVAIAVGIALNATITPRFQSESQVLVGAQNTQVLNVEAFVRGLTANSETVQSEAYVVTSRPLVETVARKLNLDRYAEFNPALQNKGFSLTAFLGVDQAKAWFGRMIKNSAETNENIGAEETGGDPKWRYVVGALQENVEAVPLNRSHVISIVAQSEDAGLAARIANAFAETYLEQQVLSKQSLTENADKWLEQRAASLREQVSRADQAVEEYRRKHNLYETKSDTVIAQQMAELNRELVLAQNVKFEAETRYQQARAQVARASSVESLPAVLQSPVIQNLRSQQSLLEQKGAELASSYTDKHPMRQHIRAQISEINRKIGAEVKRIVSSLAQEVSIADESYRRIRQQMESLQTQMGQANAETVTLRQLEREAEANRTMLVTLLQRSKETVGQQSLQAPDARLISQATVPLWPVYPPSGLIMVLAAFIGFGGSVMLALMIEGSSRTFRVREEVERDTRLPLLAVIPTVSRSNRSGERKHSPYWDAMQSLNTRLCLNDEDGGAPASVMFTSAMPREGKTSISVAYAKILASEGQRVVILELDWKRPTLNAALGQPGQVGLAELLHGLVTPEEAVYRDPDTGLHAIFAGNVHYIEQSNVWLARLRLLLNTLSNHYDVVVLDTAPLSVTPEILHIARLVEQTVFVVKWNDTPRRAVQADLASLQNAGAHLGGVILSRVDLKRYRQQAYGEGSYGYPSHLAYGAS